MTDLRAFTPTLCRLMGIPLPALASGRGLEELGTTGGPVTKALVYCPDAFGLHALERFPQLHARLRAASTHEIGLTAVFPPVTPVCFATLFTGAAPAEHGIRAYERPALACDTLFDALLRARKSIAIATVAGSSIDLLFRGRALDRFALADDRDVTMKALELIERGRHDVIVVYHQEYDDLLHAGPPLSAPAAEALERHVASWELMLRTADAAWGSGFLAAFAPDHGAHLDPQSGNGDHGEDRPEDMGLRHFFAMR